MSGKEASELRFDWAAARRWAVIGLLAGYGLTWLSCFMERLAGGVAAVVVAIMTGYAYASIAGFWLASLRVRDHSLPPSGWLSAIGIASAVGYVGGWSIGLAGFVFGWLAAFPLGYVLCVVWRQWYLGPPLNHPDMM